MLLLFSRPTVELMKCRIDHADICREREILVLAFDELVRDTFIRLSLDVVPSVLRLLVLGHAVESLGIAVEVLAANLVGDAPADDIVESAAFEPEFVLLFFLDIGKRKVGLRHLCTALDLVESLFTLCGVTASDASLSIEEKGLGIACALGIGLI